MKTPQFLISLAAMSGVILPLMVSGAALAADKRIPVAEAGAVVDFWREAGPALWFAKDDAFDRRFRDCFLPLHEAAARGDLSDWLATADGALALMVLLDQFPRNAFRGTPRMYAPTRWLARSRIAQSKRGTTARSMSSSSFSICRSVIPRTWPTRSDPWPSRAASESRTSHMPKGTATLSVGSAASRIATPSSGAA